ncbi:MAG: mechanosensitive ion channel family protein [Lysobacteraceae bacterium]
MAVTETPDLTSMLTAIGEALRDPYQGVQLGVVAVALLLAWWLGARWLRMAGAGWRGELRQRVVRPLLVFAFAGLGLLALRLLSLPTALLQLAAALALAMVVIRLVLYLLRLALKPGPLLMASEQLISVLVWLAVALFLLGWLAPAMALLDAMAVTVGEGRFSLLDLIALVLVAAVLLLLGSLFSRFVERRVMGVTDLSIGLRVGVAKVVQFAVVLMALLIALNMVGINLTSLAVFSGALGVGIGFGLQRIASNFISGFILIGDRSIRPGDVITIGDSFGWVKALNARYVVVRDRDGVERLIPNENLITTEVINWSYSDKAVRLKVPVQVSYDDDPIRAMALLVEVGKSNPRVDAEPEPVARLLGFGDSGIELELRVWIHDPQEGVNNIRSELNVGIWKAFKAEGITIPFPQRDLHVKSLPARRRD